MTIISFRPTKKVRKYLKWLNNKSKEINDIIEEAIWMPLKYVPLDFPSNDPPELDKPKDVKFKVSDEFLKEQSKEESPMQKVLSEITQKVINSDDFYDEPVKPVKDKKYYKDLEIYKEIKKRHWCVDKYWERLDTEDALKYAWLQDFIPLD